MTQPWPVKLALAALLSSGLVQSAPVPAPPAAVLTSYGSPVIPNSQNFSTASSQYADAPKKATYPGPSKEQTASHVQSLNLGMPKVKSFTYSQPMLFVNEEGESHPVLRDLGFSGVLDGKVVWTWGDTLVGTPEHNFPTAVDSTSITYDLRYPFLSKDTNMDGSGIKSLVPLNAHEQDGGGYLHYAFGGTNIIEEQPNLGLMYYLINHRAIGDLEGTTAELLGAGAAEVHLDENDKPVVRRFGNALWTSTEPLWGDVGIAYDPRDDYTYVYGHGPATDSDLSSFVYLCRVKRMHAAYIDDYEYFDNSTGAWSKQRIGDGTNGTKQVTKEMAVFGWQEMNQAAPFWSNHYKRWLYIHGSGYASTPVLLKSAEHLQGPWIDHGEVAPTLPDNEEDGNNMRYAVMGHPEFDDSGKTVVVTWTRANRIYGGVIEFEDVLPSPESDS